MNRSASPHCAPDIQTDAEDFLHSDLMEFGQKHEIDYTASIYIERITPPPDSEWRAKALKDREIAPANLAPPTNASTEIEKFAALVIAAFSSEPTTRLHSVAWDGYKKRHRIYIHATRTVCHVTAAWFSRDYSVWAIDLEAGGPPNMPSGAVYYDTATGKYLRA